MPHLTVLLMLTMTEAVDVPHAGAPARTALEGGGGDPIPAPKSGPTAPPPRALLAPIRNGASVGTGSDGGGSTATTELPPLRPATDGSGDLIHDAPGFSARIAPDGAVRFKDKGLTITSFLPFLPVAGPRNVPSVQDTVMGMLRKGRAPVADDNARNDSSFLPIPLLTPYRPDPLEECRACKEPLKLLPLGVAGKFDLTDELMRLSGQDPYRYEKALFLRATRELRVARAARVHADDIRHAAAALPRHLKEIGCDRRLGRRERRQTIERLREELNGGTAEAQSAAAEITRYLAAHLREDQAATDDDRCIVPAGDSPPPP